MTDARTVEAVEFQPSGAQRAGMPLAVLGVCLFFSGLLALVKGGLLGVGLGIALAALGVWGAWAVRGSMQAARVGADAEGVWFRDGTRRGPGDQRARWEQVAACTVENRDVDGGKGQPHIVLKGDDGRTLFVLYGKYLSPADTAALLGFIRAKLPAGAAFQEPGERL